MCLGGGGGFETLHYLLENPWQATLPGGKGGSTRKLSFEFLKAVEAQSSFETSPMYAIGHEVRVGDGRGFDDKQSTLYVKLTKP
jgi:hypothetical protein